MKIKVIAFIIFILSLNSISCENNNDNHLPFSFEYNTFNINGDRVNKFREGENIIFSLRIYNHSNDPYWVSHFGLNFTDIFKIYKKLNSSESVFTGKLYKDLVCQTAATGVPPKDYLEIKTSLYNSNNSKYSNVCNPGDSTFLSIGQYNSSFSYSFPFYNDNEYFTDTLTFKLEFEVVGN